MATLDELHAALVAARDARDTEAYRALIPQFTAAGRPDIAAMMTATLDGHAL